MSEAEYFEQFTGDVDAEIADSIPAFHAIVPIVMAQASNRLSQD